MLIAAFLSLHRLSLPSPWLPSRLLHQLQLQVCSICTNSYAVKRQLRNENTGSLSVLEFRTEISVALLKRTECLHVVATYSVASQIN